MSTNQRLVFAACVGWAFPLCVALLAHTFLDPYDNSEIIHSSSTFGFLFHWDAVYFRRIASHGYEFEQTHAFFPGLPFLAKKFTQFGNHLFSPNFGFILFTLILNLFCRIGTTLILYNQFCVLLTKSSRQVSKSGSSGFHSQPASSPDPKIPSQFGHQRAYRTALWFALLNPANIFFSVFYTESLYAFLSFTGIYLTSVKKYFLGAFFFILAGCLRSNAIILVGFLLYPLFTLTIQQWFPNLKITVTFGDLLQIICGVPLVFTPYIAFQYYGWSLYCPGRPWCDSYNMYGFIQKEYWGNGFLSFWQVSQIPNFILAFPCAFIILFSTYSHWKKWIQIYNPVFFCHIVYTCFLVFVAGFFMHVHVMTRFIASSAPLFFFILSDPTFFKRNVLYSSSYTILGSVLFSTFNPWT